MTCSIGSCSLPSILRVTTWGLPTVSSKPSRRIVSMRTASCSSPRPWTSQASGRSVGSTRSETLPTSSRSRRSFTMRAVSSLPSVPASGDVLMPIVIDRLGSSTCSGSSAIGVLRVGQGLADGDVLEAGDGDDVAGTGALGGDALERLGDEELGDLGVLDRAVDAAPRHALAALEVAVDDATERESPEVRRGVEVADERLEPVALFVLRGGHVVGDRLEERREVARRGGRVERGPALARARVEDREGDLVLVGVEVEEEVLHLVRRPRSTRASGRSTLLIDQHDGQALLEGLAQDEARLGQGALGGVDEQDDGVDHGQAALDLAAEVGVAGGVDDVDREAVPLDGGVLGEDGDALFALEVARVHDPVGELLVGGEGARLAQHLVDERGLSVVDVGDDGDISEGRSVAT